MPVESAGLDIDFSKMSPQAQSTRASGRQEPGAFDIAVSRRTEHRLFSFITQNGRARPLVSYQTVVQLIAAIPTDAGLKAQCEIDPNTYPAGVKVTNAEMDAINIRRHKFHSNGNYTIKPQTPICSDSL